MFMHCVAFRGFQCFKESRADLKNLQDLYNYREGTFLTSVFSVKPSYEIARKDSSSFQL